MSTKRKYAERAVDLLVRSGRYQERGRDVYNDAKDTDYFFAFFAFFFFRFSRPNATSRTSRRTRQYESSFPTAKPASPRRKGTVGFRKYSPNTFVHVVTKLGSLCRLFATLRIFCIFNITYSVLVPFVYSLKYATKTLSEITRVNRLKANKIYEKKNAIFAGTAVKNNVFGLYVV